MSHSDAVAQISAGFGRVASAGGKQVCVWSESGALDWQADADEYEVTNVLAHSSGRVLTKRVTALAFVGDALFFGRADGGVERLVI